MSHSTVLNLDAVTKGARLSVLLPTMLLFVEFTIHPYANESLYFYDQLHVADLSDVPSIDTVLFRHTSLVSLGHRLAPDSFSTAFESTCTWSTHSPVSPASSSCNVLVCRSATGSHHRSLSPCGSVNIQQRSGPSALNTYGLHLFRYEISSQWVVETDGTRRTLPSFHTPLRDWNTPFHFPCLPFPLRSLRSDIPRPSPPVHRQVNCSCFLSLLPNRWLRFSL